MPAPRSASDPGSHHARLAPAWHTAALVVSLLTVAVVGTVLAHRGVSPSVGAGESRVLGVYLPLVVVNWGLCIYVTRVGLRRSTLSRLLGRGFSSTGRALADVGLGLGAALVLGAAETAWHAAVGEARPEGIQALLPRDTLERVAWCVVALSVGFCEEVVYRGYLQQQLGARSGRVTLGLVLQALLFAVAHGEQGFGAASRMGLYGLGLGALALSRGSLIPGIIAHVALDLAAGLAR